MDSRILAEADRLGGAGGARSASYGPPLENHQRIAAGWSAMLGIEVTPRMVPLMMIWLKLCRECHRPGHDNLVDIAGYVKCVEEIDAASVGAAACPVA